MSETDDTDDLLLIPPDFFVTYSDTEDPAKPFEPYYQVVDSLISQVNILEHRINSIKNISDSSFDYTMDSPIQTGSSTSGVRKFNSWEDVARNHDQFNDSTQSTPLKPRMRVTLNSLPCTPSKYVLPPKRTQAKVALRKAENRKYIPKSYNNPSVSKKESEMLSEIDSFISNVKIIHKYHTARDLNEQFLMSQFDDEPKSKDYSSSRSKTDVHELNAGNKDKQLDVEQESGDNEIYKEKQWKVGENKNSVPDLGVGMRNILYDDEYKTGTMHDKEKYGNQLTVSPLNTEEPFVSIASTMYCESSPSLSSSDSTQLTAYQNKITRESNSEPDKINSKAMHVLNLHKNLLTRMDKGDDVPKQIDKANVCLFQNDLFNKKPDDYDDALRRNKIGLLSLAELWKDNGNLNSERMDRTTFLNKLQEEKLRRQYCEQLIQKLQTRTLELQERLAVAVQVDLAKDDAILHVHKSWDESASVIDSLKKEKSYLEQQIADLESRISFELADAAKKVMYYENESSKALNLAHTNQEKLAALEQQNSYLMAEIRSFENKLKEAQNNYEVELVNNQQLAKILTQKEIEFSENKNVLSHARNEVGQSKKAVEICQAELLVMKNQQTQLTAQLNEKIEHIKIVEGENKTLVSDVDANKHLQKTLQDDLNKQKNLNEQNKVELRNFYQDQVEIVVKEKLREFQSQLEKAERSLQGEIKSRELGIAKAAAGHIQQITEKHSLEVHLIEEKHKEEVKLGQLQLSQAQQQIEKLQVALQLQQERRSNIAQQLYRVMEAQWQEALKILSNGKSPMPIHDKETNTMDKLNSLKSKSYNNVEEILLKNDKLLNDVSMQMMETLESASSRVEDSFCDSKAAQPSFPETPVTSRQQKNRQQLENELQKYVQMLLNKSPGNPKTDDQNPEKIKTSIDDQYFTSQYQPNDNDKLYPEGTKFSKTGSRERSGKRPWK